MFVRINMFVISRCRCFKVFKSNFATAHRYLLFDVTFRTIGDFDLICKFVSACAPLLPSGRKM